MSDLVVDASTTLAWFLGDESDATADAALDRLGDAVAHVPAIWSAEVANALVVAERRGRLTEAESERVLAILDALPLEEDPAPREVTQRRGLELARRHRLSAYDAAYLELAMRRGCALATLDGGLRRAAEKAGVEVV